MSRIAIVTNTAWNILNFRMGLMRQLREQGHEVICVAPADERVQKIEENGFRFVPLLHLSRKGMNILTDFRFIGELYHIYKTEQIDIALHFTVKPNIYGAIAASLARIRSVCTITGLGYTFLNRGLANRITKLLFRIALRQADRVVFQNNDDRVLFISSRLVTPEKTVLINGSGVDTEYFKPRHQVRPAGEKFKLLYIGRLLYDKGLRELYEVSRELLHELPDIEFHIVGGIDPGNPSAIRREFLDEWLKEETGVLYHGVTEDIRPYIAEADVIILPSYREGLPRTNLEAMCMEKPIITTDVPGCKDTVIEGQNGLKIEVRNPESLANAIRRMINLNDQERHTMGINGRQMAIRHFDEKIVIGKYLNIIHDIGA